jgi:exodeoxyribonuclease VII large subunit
VLSRNLREAQRALAGQKLAPALIERPLAERRERLAALQRVMRSLDPDTVLRRGYVRVTGPDGRTLTDKAVAEKEAALTLKFRDGDLDVVPGGSPTPPTAPRRKLPKKGTAPKQDDLFG